MGCPFMDYQEVPFEDILFADYLRLFGEKPDDIDFRAPDDHFDTVFAKWNVLGIATDREHSEWPIALILCLMITVSVLCLLQINCSGTRWIESRRRKIRNETVPLI